MKHDEHLCVEIHSTLPLYVGGDLEAQALAEVRAHLAACPGCAERALAARAARRELVAALRIGSRPGPDLWDGVRAALADEGVLSEAPAAARISPEYSHRWRRFAAAAALVAGAFALGHLWKRGTDPTAPGTREPAPIAEAPRGAAPSIPVVPVGLPAHPSGPANDVVAAGTEAVGGGLRRLEPGERQLREYALPIFDTGAHIQAVPFGRQGGVAPVGLRRVSPEAPRW